MTQFLQDQSGNRRFMVLPVLKLIAEHNVDIDQLWAHATHWFKQGEPLWLDEKDPQQRDAMAAQSMINLSMMYGGDELFTAELNEYYDITAPRRAYTKHTFLEVRRCIPSLSNLIRSSNEYKVALKAFTIWIQRLPFGIVIPNTNPQMYLIPPLRSSMDPETFAACVTDEK
jgi:hypothetical protein